MTKTADVQLVIGQRLNTDPPLTISTFLYESSLVKNVGTTSLVTIPITQKIVIDPFDNQNLVVNLFGYDSSDKKLLYSSGGLNPYTEGQTGLFVLMTSSGGITLRFECAYE